MRTVDAHTRQSARASVPYLVAGAALAVAMLVLHRPLRHDGNDGELYWRMATGQPVTLSPFPYRVLVPWLAGRFRDPEVGFVVISWASLTAACGLFHRYLRRLGLDAWLGFWLLLSAGVVVATTVVPESTDGPTLLIMVAGLYLISARRWLAVLLLCLPGVLVREAALFVAGLAAARSRRAWLLVGPVAVYAFLRLTIAASGPGLGPSAWREVIEWRVMRDGSLAAAVLVAVVLAGGLVWPYAAQGWQRATSDVRGNALLVLPWAATCLIASDWFRMLGFALPAVIPLALSARPSRTLLAASGAASLVLAVAYLR